MADNDPQATSDTKQPKLEFLLVVIMLVVLTILIGFVFLMDLGGHEEAKLAWRKDILSLIITAFGAWVGAGAAYFFGRENLRMAANSMLAMRDLSPRERLRQTTIKQIPPTTIDWRVQRTTAVDDVKDKLISDPGRWFIPVVKRTGAWKRLLMRRPYGAF